MLHFAQYVEYVPFSVNHVLLALYSRLEIKAMKGNILANATEKSSDSEACFHLGRESR